MAKYKNNIKTPEQYRSEKMAQKQGKKKKGKKK